MSNSQILGSDDEDGSQDAVQEPPFLMRQRTVIDRNTCTCADDVTLTHVQCSHCGEESDKPLEEQLQSLKMFTDMNKTCRLYGETIPKLKEIMDDLQDQMNIIQTKMKQSTKLIQQIEVINETYEKERQKSEYTNL